MEMMLTYYDEEMYLDQTLIHEKKDGVSGYMFEKIYVLDWPIIFLHIKMCSRR